MGKTLKEISTEKADKQPHLVDSLTEEAPILARLPFEEASHDLFDIYEGVDEVTAATWVPMNAPLPAVDAQTVLSKIDLNILGGEIECPEDTANAFGSKEAYFAKKLPKVMRKSGMDAESRILYDNFRRYAIDCGNVESAGAESGGTYSILAVRYVTGETCGLYSPKAWAGSGTLLDMKPIGGGDLYKGQSGKHAGVLLYGLRLKAYMGLKLANPRTVGAIVNINGTKIPTATQIDMLLANVRATPGSTFLFMHEKVKALLQEHKGKSLQVATSDKDMNRTFTHWNGIEVLTSYNFLDGTEGVVTL